MCLTEVSIENFCGFLFANLDPLAEPMKEWYPNVAEELSAFVPDINDLFAVEWIAAAENCNWKVSVENYSQCLRTHNRPRGRGRSGTITRLKVAWENCCFSQEIY